MKKSKSSHCILTELLSHVKTQKISSQVMNGQSIKQVNSDVDDLPLKIQFNECNILLCVDCRTVTEPTW